MHTLTPQQIASVFALYTGQEFYYGYFNKELLRFDIMSRFYTHFIGGDAKLLLTPLSMISDEDAIVVAKIIMPNEDYKWTPGYGRLRLKDISATMLTGTIWWQVFQHLIHQGYAVPLFIEPGHPDNGKTAIELGLAMDKTKELAS